MEEVKPLRAGMLIIWASVSLFLSVMFGFCVGFYFDYQHVFSWSNYLLFTGSILGLVILILLQTALLYKLEKHIEDSD
jgi:hypothetical protein